MVRRKNVDLIIMAIADLNTATTSEIIGWIQRHGCMPPPPRVVSQICSCLPVIKKDGMRGVYVIWGKTDDFEERTKIKNTK